MEQAQQQQAQGGTLAMIDQALRTIAHHEFDPTMRQLMAQVFHGEQAGVVSAQALQQAATTIRELVQAAEGQDREIAALKERIAKLEAEAVARDLVKSDLLPVDIASAKGAAVNGKSRA